MIPRSLADLDVSQRLALDVTDDASVTAAFGAAGDVDIVIVNPAEIFYAAVEAIPLAELQRLFNLNTVGAIRVAQAALPLMRSRGDGKLMFMSSVSGGSCFRPARRMRRQNGRWRPWWKRWPSRQPRSASRRPCSNPAR